MRPTAVWTNSIESETDKTVPATNRVSECESRECEVLTKKKSCKVRYDPSTFYDTRYRVSGRKYLK